MMKHLNRLVLAGLLALIPNVASAGFLGWFYQLDPKMWSGEYTLPLFCFDKEWAPVKFKRHNGFREFEGREFEGREADKFENIKREFGLRLGYAHDFKDRFKDDRSDKGSLNVIELMGTYHYRPRADDRLAIEVAAGYVFFGGTDADGREKFHLWRGVVSPGLVVFPFERVQQQHRTPIQQLKNKFNFRVSYPYTYVTKGLNGTDFGNNITTFQTPRVEWKYPHVGIDFDFRR
jgi:hypothetical protein